MDLRDRTAPRPSRSHSTSSHVSSVSSQSYPITPNDSTSTFPSNHDDLDNDLAQAALSLGMMRSGASTSKPRSYSGTARPSSSSASSFQPDSLRSASMTPSGSWSHSGLDTGTRSTSPSSKNSVFEEPEGTEEQEVLDPNFMSRVSQLPIVSGGLEWYERSKASSRVVKVSSLSSLIHPQWNLGQYPWRSSRIFYHVLVPKKTEEATLRSFAEETQSLLVFYIVWSRIGRIIAFEGLSSSGQQLTTEPARRLRVPSARSIGRSWGNRRGAERWLASSFY